MTRELLVAASLCLLFASCSTTRSTTPGSEDLTNMVLVIRELPDGQVTHSWQSAEGVDLSQYRHPSNSSSSGDIMPVAARPRDCDQELQDCYQDCMRKPLPRGYGHVRSPRSSGGKSEYCRETCGQPYQDCVELQGLKPQEFASADHAVEVLKPSRKAILVGSVVLIAGVVFVTVSAGAGLLVLAPMALVVAP
jgi:hypothetical protein